MKSKIEYETYSKYIKVSTYQEYQIFLIYSQSVLHTQTKDDEVEINPKLKRTHQDSVEESPLEKLKRLENGEVINHDLRHSIIHTY